MASKAEYNMLPEQGQENWHVKLQSASKYHMVGE